METELSGSAAESIIAYAASPASALAATPQAALEASPQVLCPTERAKRDTTATNRSIAEFVLIDIRKIKSSV